MADWPDSHHAEWRDEELEKKWARLICVREAVLKKLEEKRSSGEIGSGLEARVLVASPDNEYKKLLMDMSRMLRYIFIVSQAEVKDSPAEVGDLESTVPVAIRVEKASGAKCQRCWNYSDMVGMDSAHPALCERCVRSV
jgi:isoleucyl-tRNA synthetase